MPSKFFLGNIQAFAGIFPGINLDLCWDEKSWENPGCNLGIKILGSSKLPIKQEKTAGKAKGIAMLKVGNDAGKSGINPGFPCFQLEAARWQQRPGKKAQEKGILRIWRLRSAQFPLKIPGF